MDIIEGGESLKDRLIKFHQNIGDDPEIQAAIENLEKVYNKKFAEAFSDVDEDNEEWDDACTEFNEELYDQLRESDPDEFSYVDLLAIK